MSDSWDIEPITYLRIQSRFFFLFLLSLWKGLNRLTYWWSNVVVLRALTIEDFSDLVWDNVELSTSSTEMEDDVSWPNSKFLQTAVSIKITLRLQKSRSTQDKIQIAKFTRKWQALVDLQHVVEMLQSSLHLLKLFLSSPTWELNHRFMEESWNPKP
jgi:hypothetical protein